MTDGGPMGHAGMRGRNESGAIAHPELVPPGADGLRLTLFDGWRLVRNGGDVHVPVRGQRLAALLGLRGPQTRALVGGTLWPEAGEQRAQTSVGATLWALQQQAAGLVQAVGCEIRLGGHVSVDVMDFLAHARGLLRPRDQNGHGTPSSAWLSFDRRL